MLPVMVTLSLLLPRLAHLVSFFILFLPSPIRSLLPIVSRACFYRIRDLCRIRIVLDFDTSFVHSKLDCCNSMYYCLPKSQLNRLQYVQNALAHVVGWRFGLVVTR